MSLAPRIPFTPLAGEPNPFQAEIPRPRERHIWSTPLDFTGHRSEAELAERVLERLVPWFFIEDQVQGEYCSGKDLRIDAIIRPRNPEQWQNPDVALGLEFKAFNCRDSTISAHDVTGLAAQAIDYTHVEWKGYRRVPVFTCPGALQWLGGNQSGEFNRGAQMYRNLLGQLGVGELLLFWGKGLTLYLSANHVWNEREGVRRGRNWDLTVRSGSR
ncbi:hypothetical protein [Streptomyces yanii]|uniref:Restriction endonuclease n=1 Tax=Streptomyces yanii TaxID=78510 RepID=A0ABV5RGU4_9ACTN